MTDDQTAGPAPSLALLIGTLLAGLVVLCAPNVLADGDTYWHVGAGRWMLEHAEVLKRDVFSYTRQGAPWDAHEWLAEILMAGVLRLAGWSGVLVLLAAAAAGTAWLIIGWLERFMGGLALTATALLSGFCMAPSLLARPHFLALPLLALWTVGMLKARSTGRAPHPALLAVMVVWANLHGSYVFGFVMLGAFALEALADSEGDRWSVIRNWGLFGALTLVAALITPQGIDGLIYPFKLMSMTTLNVIDEWRPADFTHVQPFEITLLTALFVCLSRGVRVPMLRLALLLLLLHMGLQHARHQLVLAVVAPLILAEPLGLALGEHAASPWRGLRLWPIAVLAGLLIVTVRIALPTQRHDGVMSPISALAHVPADLAAEPVLNDYGYGGYLIFKGVHPFIDGRSDMYGDSYVTNYVKATHPDPLALKTMLSTYKIAWTIFPAGDPVVGAMDAQPGWRRLYADKFTVVHVRATDPTQTQTHTKVVAASAPLRR